MATNSEGSFFVDFSSIGQVFTDFADWLLSVFNDITQFISGLFGYISGQIEIYLLNIMYYILNAAYIIFELIPFPDFLNNSLVFTVSSTVAWFLVPFEIPFGVSVISSALIGRFIVRRLPVIG